MNKRLNQEVTPVPTEEQQDTGAPVVDVPYVPAPPSKNKLIFGIVVLVVVAIVVILA